MDTFMAIIAIKTPNFCPVYQTGYATGWDKYIWAAEHTCYRCVWCDEFPWWMRYCCS
jgi:hypothetical protein